MSLFILQNLTLLAYTTPVKQTLEKHLKASLLKAKKGNRPSVNELVGDKILQAGPMTAAIVCPGVRPKILVYEGLE